MDKTDYRNSFASYNSAIELAHFEHRAGLKLELPVDEILDRYSDLFTLDSVGSLAKAYDETPATADTERAALRSLLSSARVGYLEFAVRDLINERAQCESAARIMWDGDPHSAHSVPRMIATEREPGRRRELLSRYVDALSTCDDLRAACFDSYHHSARELGFKGYRDLYTDITCVDFSRLISDIDSFLLKTEVPYTTALSRELSENRVGVGINELSYSDHLYLQRMHRLDRYFPANGLLKMYTAALGDLGISVEKQGNIHIDLELRPSKNPRAACFRVDGPNDVRLSLAPMGGSYDYTVLFHEAGHAQHFAWSSRELVARYPEFLFVPENATSEGYAFLFSNLFHDPLWVAEYGSGFDSDEAGKISRSLALLTLYTVRRYCAKLKYEISLHDSAQVRSEHLSRTYSTLQAEATLFARPPAMYLMDVDDGFYAAAYLRAWAFEAGLRELLRTRYGRRWWASRKAGDELIDLWNTASRYSVEELAGLIGIGEVSFELLAEMLIEAVRGE
jgi:hypothetical protein